MPDELSVKRSNKYTNNKMIDDTKAGSCWTVASAKSSFSLMEKKKSLNVVKVKVGSLLKLKT